MKRLAAICATYVVIFSACSKKSEDNGSPNVGNNALVQRVHDLVREAFSKDKVVGLLCASTGLLGLVGNWDGKSKPIAEGRKAVGYFRVARIIRDLGKANYVEGGDKEPGVAVDGNLVTGRNPESSVIFGKKVVEVLKRRK